MLYLPSGMSLYLFLCLLCFQGEVSQEIYKLGSLSSIGWEFWPDGPHEIQQ